MKDLAHEEQARVRSALRALRVQIGGWKILATALGFRHRTVKNVNEGRTVSVVMAFRVAKLADVSVEDLLAGRFPPPGTCPHCGQVVLFSSPPQ